VTVTDPAAGAPGSTDPATSVPDTTGPALALLRELRRGQGRKQAANAAFWAYLAVILLLVYGGSLVAAAVRALRHPPPAGPSTQHVLHAAPAGLAALALVLLLVLLRDALWRGPVTLPRPAVDWLLGTPVDRGALLRPRFRRSAALAAVAGAAVGIVPAAAGVELGLGGRGAGGVLRLTGASMLGTALLFAAATGAAALVERSAAAARGLRRATPVAAAAVAALAGLAAWAALGRPPAVLSAVALWSGPWGWAAQPAVAAAGGSAPLWPAAVAGLAVAAAGLLAAGLRAAPGVPGAALRSRAATLGAMSAAVVSMDSRGVALAYSEKSAARRARLRLRPPRRAQLIIVWRDLVAMLRAPSRLGGAVALAVAGVGLVAVARHGAQVSLVPVGCGLALGYLAAAWLCEGARQDADDTRRSVHLPYSFGSLAWRHGVAPCLVLAVVAGAPAVALSLAAGEGRLLVVLAVTIPALVGGALVNVYRGQFPPDLFSGVETPMGNTAALSVVFWYAWGPILAIAPLTPLVAGAISTHDPGAVARAVVVGAGLAGGLGAYAVRRATRLRTGS
jgi:Family of unknown function (DUF6297)